MSIITKEIEARPPVVDSIEAQNKAHSMGERESEGDTRPSDLSHYKESARWCNIISPKLKALAGGEFDGDKVVTLEDTDDMPMRGRVVSQTLLYEELVQAFDAGAMGDNLE